jgi:hypothetical protein
MKPLNFILTQISFNILWKVVVNNTPKGEFEFLRPLKKQTVMCGF